MKRFIVKLLITALIAHWSGIGEAGQAQPEKLRVAMASISTSQVNLWVPLDTGLFKKHGLDVDLVFISGAPVVNAALLSGEVALAQGGPAPAIQTNLKGAGTYIILGNTNRFPVSTGRRAEYSANLGSERQTFRHRRIGAADQTATLLVMPRFGIQPEKDMNLIAVGAVPSRFAALASGSVRGDAADPTRNHQSA